MLGTAETVVEILPVELETGALGFPAVLVVPTLELEDDPYPAGTELEEEPYPPGTEAEEETTLPEVVTARVADVVPADVIGVPVE